MSLTDQINQDVKEAMKAREKDKLEALRAIKSALLLEATKGGDKGISEEAELKILKKLHKQRIESAQLFEEQGREDLASVERMQAEVIEMYLPEMMGEDQVREIVREVISQVGAESPADMGKVMGPTMGKIAGKADGKLVSKVVKEELA